MKSSNLRTHKSNIIYQLRNSTLLLLFIIISQLAVGQSLMPGDEEQKDWNFVVTPYFWFGGLNGQMEIANIEADIDASFSDIASNLKMGFMLYGEARYKKFGIAIDWLALSMSINGTRPISGGAVQVDPAISFLETSILFSAIHNKKWSVDIYAGVRTWWVNALLEVEKPIAEENRTAEKKVSWVDPIIGAKAIFLPHKKWPLNAKADIGGFGAGSQFTWQVQAGAGFRFAKSWTVLLQYRALSVDYSQGTEGNKDYFKMNTTLFGPLIGLMVTF